MDTVYTDDPDRHWTRQITDEAGNDLDWEPLVAAGSGAYDITAAWQGTVGPTREIKVPLDSLTAGHYTLFLKVPGGNDYSLGVVAVLDRS
jgi:hypothetical protein